MKLYIKNDYYKLYHGSMLDMLEVIEPQTIDSIVTDPPYGLTSITKRFGKEDSSECKYGKDGSFQRLSKGFMGKEWDGSGIEYNIETWKKCYEVLKPGGYLLAFGGSRTFHRIACAIEDAGFEIRDTIMWLYGSGFPKSMDISKQIDKRPNGGYSNLIKFGNYIKKARENKKISKKELGKLLFSFDSNREDVPIQSWEIGKEIPKKEIYEKVKEILELNDEMDFIFEEAEREVIGEKIDVDGKPRRLRYKNIVSNASCWNTLNTKEKMEKASLITAPSTDLAKQWNGWGTALKPSFEPIIVARKPFKGSLVDNVIEYGVGGINIDECRVETNDEVKMNIRDTSSCSDGWNRPWMEDKEKDKLRQEIAIEKANNLGRFPANTILTYDDTDFDEVCGGFPNCHKAGNKSFAKRTDYNASAYKIPKNYSENPDFYGDSGSASRYFYCAKASKKDRDEGLDNFEDKKFYSTLNTKNGSGERLDGGTTPIRKNTHPTVKPTELMQYLIRLVSPDGATILDPFNGSGSTGKAVMYENKERNKNYKYIGIELTEEYLPIAKARIEYAIDNNVKSEKKEDTPEGQLTIFDLIKGSDSNDN